MRRVLATLSLTIPVLACNPTPSASATALSRLDTADMIPLSAAIQIAAERLPTGFIVSAKLDDEDAGAESENEPRSYEIVVFTADTGELWHVGVDVATGELLEVEIEDAAAQE